MMLLHGVRERLGAGNQCGLGNQSGFETRPGAGEHGVP